jgi:hypothetical protein
MTRSGIWRAGAVAAVALALGGCFASQTPLVTASNADTPLAAGVVNEYSTAPRRPASWWAARATSRAARLS